LVTIINVIVYNLNLKIGGGNLFSPTASLVGLVFSFSKGEASEKSTISIGEHR
jgi:hypothetical protein